MLSLCIMSRTIITDKHIPAFPNIFHQVHCPFIIKCLQEMNKNRFWSFGQLHTYFIIINAYNISNFKCFDQCNSISYIMEFRLGSQGWWAYFGKSLWNEFTIRKSDSIFQPLNWIYCWQIFISYFGIYWIKIPINSKLI